MKHCGVLFLFFLCLFSGAVSSCKNEVPPPADSGSPGDTLLVQYNALLREKGKPIAEKLALNRRLLALNGSAQDSLAYQLLRDRIGLQRSDKHLDSALFYTRRLLERAEQNQDTAIIAEAHFRLGFYNRLLNDYAASLRHYYTANDLYIGLKDSTNAGAKLLNLANLLNALGNYSEAENTAVEGLRFMEHADSTRFVSGLYNALAISTMERRNYDDALAWYLKALDIQPDSLDRVNIENNIASIHTAQGNYAEAIALLERLLQNPAAHLERNPKTYARLLDNLGHAQSKSGSINGEGNLLRALAIRDSIGFLSGQYTSYVHLADHYLSQDAGQSQAMAQKAYELSKELKNPDYRLESLALLIEATPNPREYALEYERLNDSILQVRQTLKDQYAKIRYESEQNLRNFLEAQNLANRQTLALERSRKRNFMLLGALVFMAGLGYVSYRLIRARHKRKELEAVYHTETRISKKVHDELANDIFNILNYTVNEGQEGTDHARLIDNLDQVYQKSRDISRDRAEIPTGADFADALKSLLGNYASGHLKLITKGYEQIPWEKLDPLKQVGLYRTLQELLVNMKKHSQATLVLLEFSKTPQQLGVRYKDNGLGLQNKDLNKGSGLPNTENRIQALGGTFTFEKNTQGGLGIAITLPL